MIKQICKRALLLLALAACLYAGRVWYLHASANLELAGTAPRYDFDLLLGIDGSVGFADTDLTDEELIRLIPHFQNHINLVSINLSGTKITDVSLSQLANLPNVELIDIRRTDVSEPAVLILRKALPNANIIVE